MRAHALKEVGSCTHSREADAYRQYEDGRHTHKILHLIVSGVGLTSALPSKLQGERGAFAQSSIVLHVAMQMTDDSLIARDYARLEISVSPKSRKKGEGDTQLFHDIKVNKRSSDHIKGNQVRKGEYPGGNTGNEGFELYNYALW